MQPGSSTYPRSEINVTPLIDVVLVLLIIFMMITPLMLQELQLFLPKVEITPETELQEAQGALILQLEADGTLKVRVGDAEEVVSEQRMLEVLHGQLEARRDKSVFLDVAPSVGYSRAVALFDQVKLLGGTPAIIDLDGAEHPD